MIRVVTTAVPVLLAVAWLVGAGVWNRSEVLARVTLTEREVPWRSGEGTGPARLWIEWQPRTDPLDARNWLTHDRLRRLGFDLSVPASAPPAARVYRRTLPRRAWVAFELDGDAWRAIERRREVTAGAQDLARARPSRLVPVDAGPDAAEIAAKYGDGRHLILPAWIQLNWVGPGDGGPLVYGSIRALDPPSVVVPRALASRLRALAPTPRAPRLVEPGGEPEPPAAPRYAVDLAVGRSGIPWVEDVR